MNRGAVLSDDKVYRYTLTRRWGDGKPVVWVMLNPSTADAEVDDPTITRCIRFTERWGYQAMTVVNLFAFRATDPRRLKTARDPVGPFNDTAIMDAISEAAFVVAAWGTWGSTFKRDKEFLELIGAQKVKALGVTGDGDPRHPLYLRADARLINWKA